MSKKRGAATLVAAGIFLSRIAGFYRERLFAHYFGNSDVADAFRAAMRIPNFLQNLFGEGVLSASFIPVYAGLLGEQDQKEAGKVAGAVFSILMLLTSILVVAGFFGAPMLISVIAGGVDDASHALTISLVRILFPSAGLLVMSAWCLGVLNSHRRFFLSYSVPVLWNASMIAALLVYGSSATAERLAGIVAIAALVGSAAQFLVQLPVVLRLTGRIPLSPGTDNPSVRTVVRNFGPVFISRGVVQLSAWIDAGIALDFLPKGSLAALSSAQTIYLLPVSLFGMSVSASELPEMSRATGDEELRHRLASGLRRISFLVIPSVIALIALGDLIAGAIYQGGKFTAHDTTWLWGILAGSGVGLLASTQGRLFSSAFYALKDTRTPLRFAIIRVTLTAALGYLCSVPLPKLLGIDPKWGVAGLTASAGFSGWVEYLLLRHALSKRIGSEPVGLPYLLRLWTSALVAAAAAWYLKLRLPFTERPVISAIAVLGIFGILYLLFADPRKLRGGTASRKPQLP